MKNSEIGTLDTSAARVELYRDRVAISHKKGTLAGKNVCISFGELEDAEFHEKNIMEGAYLLFRAEGMQELTYSVLSGPKMVNKGRIDLAKGETETAEKFCTDVRNALAQYRQGKPGGQYVAVCGGVNVDIGAYPFAPLVQRDSNPGRVETALGGVVRDDLGADEALLEVGVDDARALRGLPAAAERPGTDLLRTRRQEARQAQRLVRELDRAVERALLQTVALQKLRRLVVREPREIRLHLRTDHDHRATLLVGVRLERRDMRIAFARHVVIRHVRAVDDLLVREEVEFPENR